MRAMTEWRLRLSQASSKAVQADAVFWRAQQGRIALLWPLQNLLKEFIDINFAFSRTPGQHRRRAEDAGATASGDLLTRLALK